MYHIIGARCFSVKQRIWQVRFAQQEMLEEVSRCVKQYTFPRRSNHETQMVKLLLINRVHH
jgi:hypothetical protein